MRSIRTIRMVHFTAAVMLGLLVAVGSAQAGRIGGPYSTTVVAPGGLSLFYDIPFAAGAPATVVISGRGNAIVHLLMYDTDGHVAIGVGNIDRRYCTMNVYRAGVLRVEIRNLGIQDDIITIETN